MLNFILQVLKEKMYEILFFMHILHRLFRKFYFRAVE